VVHDAGQRLDPVLNQILKMYCQHLGLIQPIQIRCESFGEVREFHISIGPPQNADLEPRIEIGQGLIIRVVYMARLHLGNVKNVRDNHITRIAKDEIGKEAWRTHAGNRTGSGKQMRGCHIASAIGAKRIQPIERPLGWTLDSTFAFIFGIKGMQSPAIRCNF
jgi:hypothetical protein